MVSVSRKLDGSVRIANLTPWTTAVLCELVALLDPNQPESVRRRLFPKPSDDVEHQREWERYVHPDLFALIATARDVVEKDLETLELPRPGDADPGTGWRLEIPAAHVSAWISALNTGRLTLAEKYSIGEADLDVTEIDVLDEASLAVAKMRLFGWLQQLVIESTHPGIDEAGDDEGE